jgi:hypothetical protein
MPQSIQFTVPTFCRTIGISHRVYLRLRDSGEGPRETRSGRRTFISAASALAWTRATKAESARVWARRRTAIEQVV